MQVFIRTLREFLSFLKQSVYLFRYLHPAFAQGVPEKAAAEIVSDHSDPVVAKRLRNLLHGSAVNTEPADLAFEAVSVFSGDLRNIRGNQIYIPARIDRTQDMIGKTIRKIPENPVFSCAVHHFNDPSLFTFRSDDPCIPFSSSL